MNLSKELLAKKTMSAENIPKEKWDIMVHSTEQLIKEHLSDKSLKIGDKMIDFNLPDPLGNTVSLSSLLDINDKLIISFYRGGWCPYCNLELKALQEMLPEFEKAGASLVAITPETPDNSLTTSEKNNLSFSVLSDIDNIISKQVGLVFQMPNDLIDVYHSFNLNVSKHNGNDDYELPMPATYILNKKGEILYAFVPEDYTERANPKEILEIIKNN